MSINLANQGHEVHLYEFREDIRTAELVQGRSINLALSKRGQTALAAIGLEKEIVENSILMKGRMTHDLQGNTKEILYDSLNGQGLYSVGRKYLNEKLLNLAEKSPNIHMHFEKKLVTAKLDDGSLIFKE